MIKNIYLYLFYLLRSFYYLLKQYQFYIAKELIVGLFDYLNSQNCNQKNLLVYM